MSQEPTPREMGYYLALAQVGLEMSLPTLLGFWIDDWLGTIPWFTSGSAVFGFVAGLTHLILIVRQKERDEKSDKKPPS